VGEINQPQAKETGMKKNQKELLLEQLKKTPIVQIACEKSGVGRATYYRWRKEDPEFVKLADLALVEGALLINDMAETQLMSAIRERNMQAIMYWLKHHHPVYTNRIELNANIKEVHELTPEKQAIVAEILRNAVLPKIEPDKSTNGKQDTEQSGTIR